MMPAAEILRNGGVERYQRDSALRFYMLKQALDDMDDDAGQLAARSSALHCLAERKASDIVNHGSSFFWYYVTTLWEALQRGEPLAPGPVRLLLVQILDSFASVLKDSASIALGAYEGEVVLPCRRLRFAVAGHDVQILQVSADELRVDGGAIPLSIRADAPEPDQRLSGIDVSSNARLLLSVDWLLTDATTRQKIAHLSSEELATFHRMLVASLEMVRTADVETAADIDSLIRWYFPIQTLDKRNVHNSFTISHLSGAIFLSESYGLLPLVEALVHEYLHNELWLAMRIERHLRPVVDQTYYAPWRDDARPVSGLYHGTYVFTGLLEFFAAAERSPVLRDHHAHFNARRRRILHQVRTALLQYRAEDLEPPGRAVLDSLSEIVQRHADDLEIDRDPLPDIQAKHWHEWTLRHPELASTAVPPTAAGPLPEASSI